MVSSDAPAHDTVTRASDIFVRAYRSGAHAADLPNLTEADAYAVQAATLAVLGAAVGGWKVARVAGQAVAAPLLHASILPSGSPLPPGTARPRKIETELGFTLARDLPPRSITRADLIAAIASVHTVFELVGPRGGEPPDIPFTAFLADNLGNAATIVGPAQALTDLPASGRLYCNDNLMAEGPHPHGDPLAALLAYVAAQPDALGGLRAGHLVITGSFTGAVPIEAPARLVGAFDGLAPVTLTIA